MRIGTPTDLFDSTARLTLLGLTLICGTLVYRSRETPAPLPTTAPDSAFAADRAMQWVHSIAERPHPIGSSDHARVRDLLIARLRALGLDPQLQETTAIGTRYPVVGHVQNIVARIKGRSASHAAVLLASHYDGVGAGPAAADDGHGVASILETVRAVQAGPAPEHDIIVLFTDGEEVGLLGAAAFVREHPWARDVAMVLNFEARGTSGRSVMFESGKGNLDAVRTLSTLADVSSSSLFVTVYRLLPNDTDVSEFLALGTPALNFAFLDGVELYHTPYDDAAHLDRGTVQQTGTHMLALARAFSNGPLPRPVTGDAIFFDAPLLGVVAYPESWGIPIALVITALVLVVIIRVLRNGDRPARSVVLGIIGTVLAALAAAWGAITVARWLVALHNRFGWGGSPEWREMYAGALVAMAFTIAAGLWALVRRRGSAAGVHAGALIVWCTLMLATAFKLPGVSFVFAWPLMAAAIACLFDSGDKASTVALTARWIATAIACSIFVPLIYSTGGLTLPLNGAGGISVGLLVTLLVCLLLPHLESIGGARRWPAVCAALAVTVILFVVGAVTVRQSTDDPAYTTFTYTANADESGAWLLTNGAARRAVPRVIDGWPNAVMLTDTVANGVRHLMVRITAPPKAISLTLSGDPSVHAIAVDGRAIATSKYRQPTTHLSLSLIAPPDSGFTVQLDAPPAQAIALELTASTPGLPPLPGISIPTRPATVLSRQAGDETTRYRRVVLH